MLREGKDLLTANRMWCLYLVNAFQSQITSNLSAYITSDFESHSLIPLIATVSSVMAAGTYMPVAKILNLWDRSTGFALMVLFAVLGLILSATCNGIATYCAAQVSHHLPILLAKKTYHDAGVLQRWLFRLDLLCRCHHSRYVDTP